LRGSTESDAAETPVEQATNRRGNLVVTVNETPVIFWDVKVKSTYAPYVEILAKKGVIEGYKNTEGKLTGEFGGTNPVTRAELLKMVLVTAGKAPDTEKVSLPENKTARNTWAAPYIQTAEDLGLTVFRKQANVHMPATQREVAQAISDVLGVPKDEMLQPFNAEGRPTDTISRADTVKMIVLAVQILEEQSAGK
jgi:hypothetical protein